MGATVHFLYKLVLYICIAVLTIRLKSDFKPFSSAIKYYPLLYTKCKQLIYLYNETLNFNFLIHFRDLKPIFVF